MIKKLALISIWVSILLACQNEYNNTTLSSPNQQIELTVNTDNKQIAYSVVFNGKEIISSSALGLKSDSAQALKLVGVSTSTVYNTWESVWGERKTRQDDYNEIQLKVAGKSAQTIIIRAYNDGIAFRYVLPENNTISQEAYRYESSSVALHAEKPIAWFPLSPTMVSDAIDLNSWEPPMKGQKKKNKNVRYSYKPARIKTPFTVKLSAEAYISLHEAAVTQSADANLSCTGNTLRYVSDNKTAKGSASPWRTITISQHAGGLIESSLMLNVNEPNKIEDNAWIKPGKTMWDWRVHGAHANDGFEYGMTTESYIRFIDFAAEYGLEYVMVDAEWYGPERNKKSDPRTYLPQIDIPEICNYAKEKGIGIWLYINTIGLNHFDIDETLALYKNWGVVGIKQGFLNGDTQKKIEMAQHVVKKCAEYNILYVLHEPHKPTGYRRTYPNILAYEYVNSMLDGPSRPSATPSRLINLLFVHGLTGAVDRSCGMFDLDDFISREKCHRQLPSTVLSQTAQCLLFPSGLLTLPDHPDAYRRKADLFEFIAKLPMNWDETKVLEAEIGQYITLARKAGNQWFVGALANEQGRKSTLTLDFLDEETTYDVTLYEDAPDAHYAFSGPGNKHEAKTLKQKMKPHKTRRELYQVKKITAQKGDVIPISIAPGGGHCMWIRPAQAH